MATNKSGESRSKISKENLTSVGEELGITDMRITIHITEFILSKVVSSSYTVKVSLYNL